MAVLPPVPAPATATAVGGGAVAAATLVSGPACRIGNKGVFGSSYQGTFKEHPLRDRVTKDNPKDEYREEKYTELRDKTARAWTTALTFINNRPGLAPAVSDLE